MTDKDPNPSSIHPPIPPTPEDEQFTRLRLLRSRRVGVATYRRLLAEHGSAREALKALPEVAKAAGVPNYEICPEGVIRAEFKAALAKGARLLEKGVPPYPALLAEVPDAPPFLWAIGDLRILDRPMVSLVGARNASSLGTRMARALARELGEAGYVIVSGLARGIDAAAHLASLPTGTLAVQAGGVDVIYPAENTELAHDIAKTGLRLSEQPMGLQPMSRHFPSRNRLIAGLSRATVVVEAAARSGSLITARDALDHGREVLAVPGHPFDARAAGCNMLIRDGAMLVRSGADVLDAVGRMGQSALPLTITQAPPEPRRQMRQATDLHGRILARLGPSPVAEDQLIRDLRTPAAQVAPALVDLELEGQVMRQAGGLLVRAV